MIGFDDSQARATGKLHEMWIPMRSVSHKRLKDALGSKFNSPMLHRSILHIVSQFQNKNAKYYGAIQYDLAEYSR